jgi:hypothetical protein
LQHGGRAGLVGTTGLRVGKARQAALDYLVETGGTITNAVSSMLWPGDAALDVCMVNWTKGEADTPRQLIVNGRSYPLTVIPTHLQLQMDVSAAVALQANKNGTAIGVIFGSNAFTPDLDTIPATSRLTAGLRPLATGTSMLTGTLSHKPTLGIYLVGFPTERQAEAAAGPCFAHLKKHLYPTIKERAESGDETTHFARWLRTWWHPKEPQHRFFRQLEQRHRFIACSNPQARPIFVFLSSEFVPTNTLQVFDFNDDYTFGVLQSRLHWEWIKVKGGKVRADIRYTGDVWRTFSWPQQPSEAAVVGVAAAARALRETRRDLMESNNWSLRALHQAAEVPGPHPLKDAQARLDAAVAAAYDLPAGQEPLEFLLELNLALAEDEAAGRPIQGPGLPAGLDPNDPRWMSTDCIEPPPLDGETSNHHG